MITLNNGGCRRNDNYPPLMSLTNHSICSDQSPVATFFPPNVLHVFFLLVHPKNDNIKKWRASKLTAPKWKQRQKDQTSHWLQMQTQPALSARRNNVYNSCAHLIDEGGRIFKIKTTLSIELSAKPWGVIDRMCSVIEMGFYILL